MENFFTIKVVAKKLNVSVKTLRRWEKTGKFLPHHIGQKNTKFYSQLQIDEMSKMMLDTSSKNVQDVQDNVSNVQDDLSTMSNVDVHFDMSNVQDKIKMSNINVQLNVSNVQDDASKMSNVQDDLSTMSNVDVQCPTSDVQHCPPSETADTKKATPTAAEKNSTGKNSSTESEQNQDSDFQTRDNIAQSGETRESGETKNAENISENTPDISELCTQLKQIHYSELVTHGILHRAKKSGFTCPFCGNGDGESGTGIEEFIQNGIVTSHCPKCPDGDKIDNIKILAHFFHLDYKSDFREVVIQGTRELLNITFDNESYSDFLDLKAIRDLILKDITESQKNLSAFLDTRGGSWRGLTFDTLHFFRIGFLPKWSHPKNIVAGKKIFYSPRIIIQTGEQNYNAILLNEDRTKFHKKSWKLNAGNKKIFGLDFLPDNSDFIVFVEGEVDAMSIYQATEGKVFALAIGGTYLSSDCWTDLLNRFKGKQKPRILILLDNDKAGRDAVQKLCNKLVANDFPAVFKFLVEGTDKLDANDILQQQGADKLADIINNIIANSQADFEAVEKQIEDTSAPFNVKCDISMSDDLRRQIYFVGNTDLDNARRLTALFSDSVKYITDIERWAFYKKGIWEIQPTGNNGAALFLARLAHDIISSNARNEKEELRAKPFKKHKYASPAVAFFKGFDEVKINSRVFDTHQMLLPVKNGVIDLTTGNLLPYSPNMFFTKQCPVEFKGLEYRSELFDDFMQSILPDKDTRAAVLRYLGYCLTGVVSEEKALFILGNGRNGKGTLMKILLTLLDCLATSLKIDSLLQQKYKDGNSATPEFAKLDGCRLAIANEIPQGEKLDVAKFKDLTGGDKFSARNLHSNPILIEPHFKLILCGQYLPEIMNANDIGYNERLIVVKFPNQFTGDNCDPTLKFKLLAPDVLSGVLSTLVNECLAWQRDGLIISDAMAKEKQSYFDANNFIADFISEFCIISDNASCKLKELLKVLRSNYPDDIKGLSDRVLTDMLRKELAKYKSVVYRKTGTYRFFGIGLLTAQRNLDLDNIPQTSEEFKRDDISPPPDIFGATEDIEDDDIPF